MRYRTEIVVPPDRYICVQLPSFLPEGRAIVTVEVPDREETRAESFGESDPDRQDIEWWDEFGEERQGTRGGD
jgi:hypothetical protein